MNKEEEIIKKILSLPLENWVDLSTTVNGVSIVLRYEGNGMNPYVRFEESFTTIYSKDLWQILNPLNEAKDLIEKEKKENELTEILNKL